MFAVIPGLAALTVMLADTAARPWLAFTLLTGGLILAYYLVILPVWYVFFHPLRKYPGPKLWAASILPWTFMFMSGESHHKLLELHDKYGRVVRLGPNELSYIAPEAWEDIMGRHRPGHPENPKPPWYCSPNNKDITGALRKDHTRMRRILSPGFSAGAMLEQQPLIQGYVGLMIERLHEKADNGKAMLDVNFWYNCCTFDIVGDLSFGAPFGSLRESAMYPWFALVFANIKTTSLIIPFNRLPLFRLILPLLVPKKFRQQAMEHKKATSEKVSKRLTLMDPRPDFIQYMASGKNGLSLTREELDRNAEVLTMAGSETTATSLTGATYRIATNPSIMAKLVEELRTFFKGEEEIDLLSVAKLPYLCAVTEECLRTYPPGPNTQPRITPPEGNVILGEHIPGNTVLGIPHRAMYLSESNFRRAREFVPERWLGDPEFANDRRDCCNPFSYGPRNCIGKNLAYGEFRLILARMVWNFDIKIAERSLGWMDKQQSYLLWEKIPLYVHLTPRRLEDFKTAAILLD